MLRTDSLQQLTVGLPPNNTLQHRAPHIIHSCYMSLATFSHIIFLVMTSRSHYNSIMCSWQKLCIGHVTVSDLKYMLCVCNYMLLNMCLMTTEIRIVRDVDSYYIDDVVSTF